MQTQYTTAEITRFYSNIRILPNGCHEWMGSPQSTGYGRVGFGQLRGKFAHRVAWEITNGPITPGLAVYHHCDNHLCVNPAHLFLGTHNALTERRIARGIIDPVRFYSKVRISPNGCHEWQGAISVDGYGRISFGREPPTNAHRIAWILTNGPIPDGLVVCHRCDNRKCVNPAHLFLGTQGDNVRDAVRKDRIARGEKHGTAKLTDDDVREIRSLAASGVAKRAIARQYAIDPAEIRNIVLGRNWRHVT